MQSRRSSSTHRSYNLLILVFSKLWEAIITNGISYRKPKSTQHMQAMKIGFGFLLVCASIVTVTGNQCENPINGAESCGKGTFFNKTELSCTPCPPLHYQDATNHNCEDCKPCSCEEGWISADENGCPPYRDTRCVRADMVTDGPVTRNDEHTISVTTEVPPLSSTPGYRETTQPRGHPEIKKITPLEYSVAGGQEMVILGEYFRGDCEVNIMELVDDGTSVWNGTCPIDKSLSRRTRILCTMPPYKDEHLKQAAKVFLVITCDGGYASELMDHPITYNPVPDDQDQNDDQWKTRFIVLLGVVFVLFVVAFLVAFIVWWRNSKKKKNGQHLDENQGHGDIEAGAAGQNGCFGNGQLPQNGNHDAHTEETELTKLQPNDHVERN